MFGAMEATANASRVGVMQAGVRPDPEAVTKLPGGVLGAWPKQFVLSGSLDYRRCVFKEGLNKLEHGL